MPANSASGRRSAMFVPGVAPPTNFPKVILVMMENQQVSNIQGNSNAPNLNGWMAGKGANYVFLNNFWANTHPSLPNYIYIWFGNNFGITDDNPPSSHNLSGNNNLGAQLDTAGVPFSGYFQSLGAGNNPQVNQGGTDSSGDQLYQTHHNAMAYTFDTTQLNKCKDYATSFATDLTNGAFDFAYVVPDMAHDMHDPAGTVSEDNSAIADGDTWLGTNDGTNGQGFVPLVQASSWYANGGSIVIVWDEAYNTTGSTVAGGGGMSGQGGGPVICMVLSKALQGQAPYPSLTGQAGLLRGIEQFYGLPTIGDANTTTFGNILPLLQGQSVPLLGFWIDNTIGSSGLGVSQQALLDFASPGGGSGTFTSYTTLSTGGAISSTPYRLMVSVGNLTSAQATSIGNALVAGGQSHAIIRVMWEMNNDLSGDFSSWNQLAYPTAAGYIAAFQSTVTNLRAVTGNNFTFAWVPNGDSNPATDGSGNNAAGRNSLDTYPGDGYVDYIGCDIYDFYGGTTGGGAAFVTFAASHNKPFVVPEWGLNGSDDTTFMANMISLIQTPANNCRFQSYFSDNSTPNSDLTQFPNSKAAYTAAFSTE